ncbi:hypothetical protein RV09_GL001067 [Enterococcus moraviensis]|nr:hypothetical protein RV09_GL001067 [Enterococcus moraviensis]
MDRMKHFCQSIVGVLIFVALCAVALRVYTYNNTSTTAGLIDQLNPLVKTATLYTKTTEKYEYKFPDATSKIENFVYLQTCYTGDGKKRKIEYISFGKQMKPDKFLKLETKGQSVLKWEEIDKEELPEKIRHLL